MCPADGAHVAVVAAREPFKPLVDDHIMHQEIREPVHGDAEADARQPLLPVFQTEHDAEPAWDGEYEEEGIVFFKHARPWLVVVFMQVPEETVHHIAVCEPCNAFHRYKSAQHDRYKDEPIHKNVLKSRKNIAWMSNKCMANLFSRRNGKSLKTQSRSMLMAIQHI